MPLEGEDPPFRLMPLEGEDDHEPPAARSFFDTTQELTTLEHAVVQLDRLEGPIEVEVQVPNLTRLIFERIDVHRGIAARKREAVLRTDEIQDVKVQLEPPHPAAVAVLALAPTAPLARNAANAPF